MAFEQVSFIARKHMQRFVSSGRKSMGRAPSEAQVMKQAVQAFQRCAAKSVRGGVNPDCPFEHVTVLFGTRSPNRDTHLKAIAPAVRSLLERQYPQLATAQLSDGARVKYSEWQKQSAQDRKELARLRREQERLSRRLDETLAELSGAREQGEELRATLATARQEARAAGRVEQEKAVQGLRAAMERGLMEHGREMQRLESDHERLVATIASLSAERDALERALFSETDEEGSPDTTPEAELVGIRVLLVGGHEGHVPPIREYMEARGVQLLHEDGPGATELVAGVHLVVLWTRFMTHSAYFAVKRECRVRDVPYCYWTRTSPASLLALVAAMRSVVSADRASVAAPELD